MKNDKILFLSTLAIAGAEYAPAIAQDNNDKPNILWIVSEDNSPFIGCYGDKFATTPNIDKLASEGVLFRNAFCTAPVSAPSRSTLITGMFPTSLGTENMRSVYPVPSFVRFFPEYLRKAGYYTTNNNKKDYNTVDQPEVWNESSLTATYKNRKGKQPFFAVFNLSTTHESSIFIDSPQLIHNPETVPVPPYLPKTEEMKRDWALYYDNIQRMDEQVGKILQELEEAGLSENTIVFYYADNGGVLGRSKRFIFESGLHVPLIIRFPEKYKNLSPGAVGSEIDRLVTFADFAPTVLSLAGIKTPDYMQGKAFAGVYDTNPNDFAFGFRGRMDERIDLVRSIRTKQYRYVYNFLPHRIYGQHVEFLWKAKSIQSWEKAYKEGKLNDVQSAFFKEKPSEELYDIVADPHNVNNLAGNSHYKDVLEKLRKQTHNWLIESRDIGLIPEAALVEISDYTTPFEFARSDKYNIVKVLETAKWASSREPENLPALSLRLQDKDPFVRYWATTGLLIAGKDAVIYKPELEKRLSDRKEYVQIVAAEALYKLGEKQRSFEVLTRSLLSENTFIRVQALNALQYADIPDLKKIRGILADIVDNKVSEYDVKSAYFLLTKIDGLEIL